VEAGKRVGGGRFTRQILPDVAEGKGRANLRESTWRK